LLEATAGSVIWTSHEKFVVEQRGEEIYARDPTDVPHQGVGRSNKDQRFQQKKFLGTFSQPSSHNVSHNSNVGKIISGGMRGYVRHHRFHWCAR
jgi:hypothetical protein